MNQVQFIPKIRKVDIQCSLCGKNFITRIFPDRTYKGGNCFGTVSLEGKKFEYWECYKCYRE